MRLALGQREVRGQSRKRMKGLPLERMRKSPRTQKRDWPPF
jgi:hypothetical protein